MRSVVIPPNSSLREDAFCINLSEFNMNTKRKKAQPASAKPSSKMQATKPKGARNATREKQSTPRVTRRSSGRQTVLVKTEILGSEKTAVKMGSSNRLFVTPVLTSTAGHKKSVAPADAYEFSETDDFISSGQSSKTKPQKKSSTLEQKKSSGATLKAKAGARTGGEKKKQTSTPVGSAQNEKTVGKSAQAGQLLGKRRSPRTPPALLDISVTPILPVPSVSPKRRRNNNYDPQNDSMASLLPKRKAPADLEKPKAKVKDQKLTQPAPAQVSTPTAVLNAHQNRLKRKQFAEPMQSQRVRINNERNSALSVKSKRDSLEPSPKKKAKPQNSGGRPTVSASKKTNKTESKQSSVSTKKTLKQKTVITKSSRVPDSSDRWQDLNLFSPKVPSGQLRGGRKPSFSPSAQLSERHVGSKFVKKTEKEYNLSISKDSGISFGSEMSSPETSPQSASFLGFMEDEPLFGPPPDLSFSPPPSTNSSNASAKDPESKLNKSMSKSYKASNSSKVKRGKGRLSASRLDAWADKINQVMDDAESFELVIE